VIAVSDAMRQDLLACYPEVDPGRVHTIHNGIDARGYVPDHGEAALVRRGIDPGRPLIVFVGRIARQKGLDHLLRAAAQIDRAAQLVLIASAPDTPEIAAETRELCDAAQAAGASVVWIEEMVPRPELIQVLSHATAFVCPSIYEPFGLVNLEAMACEAAVVASAVGGIRRSSSTGRPLPGPLRPRGGGLRPAAARHFEATLAERINQLIADPDLATRLGTAGRRRVLERFTWEQVALRTVEVYRQAIAAHAAGTG